MRVVCNPLCGKCRPAKKIAKECKNCGRQTIVSREEKAESDQFVCKWCGAQASIRTTEGST